MDARQDNFQRELTAFLKYFEPFSFKFFAKKQRQSSRFSSLISRFYNDLADFSSGGKRMRAFLVYLGYQVGLDNSVILANGVRPESRSWTRRRQDFDGQASQDDKKGLKKILPISLAIEIIHSFLLIHDDIIDQSETRRGRPTIHKRYENILNSLPAGPLRSEASEVSHYGLSQAILLGDIACFEALSLINASPFDNNLKAVCQRQLVKIILETGYGEALDVEATYRGATLAGIRQVMDLKTARYSFVGPLTIGAILGGAQAPEIASLAKFGLSCGMAFQLKDDILGVFGDEKITGKPMDLHEGKNTILIYKARQLANSEQKAKIAALWGKKDGDIRDIREIREIISACGALAWGEREQSKLVKRAKSTVEGITDDTDLREIFYEIVDFVVNRDK